MTLIDTSLKKLCLESTSIEEYIVNIINYAKKKSDEQRLILNFYMLITTNTVIIKNVDIINNFEKNKLSYYLSFKRKVRITDRYKLLFVDNILNIYVYSFFNEFYKLKLELYLSLYVEETTAESTFEENLINYLKIWLNKID